MGQPAARQTDMTLHGGTIVAGCPNVMICSLPAARQTDMHVCPLVTPGTPPVPHVGGPIQIGSIGVMIGNLPAARMNDMALCTGPPDSIALGAPTVLIGDVSGGGGGGAAVVSNQGAAAAADASAGEGAAQGHWIRLRFIDSAGLPLARIAYEFEGPDGERSRGQLAEGGLISGSGWEAGGTCTARLLTVGNARWSADEAEAGDELTLSADVTGFDDGTPARVILLVSDMRNPEAAIAVLNSEVNGDQVEVQWTYEHPVAEEPHGAGTPAGYSRPLFRFEVQVEGITARSGFLTLTDVLEIELLDDQGEPLGDEPFEVRAADGSIREEQLDGDGRARLEGLSIRTCRVSFPNIPHGSFRAQLRES